MKNKNLRAAMIAGTVALIWSIPSLNIFGIIAVILTWVVYSSSKKGTASAAMAMYITAAVISVLFAVVLVFAGSLFGLIASADNTMMDFLNGAAVFSIVGDVLYITAAVMCYKGGKELKESDSESNGFFD